MVCQNSESSVVVDVKSKQHLDPILIELKESILNKAIETFSQGEDGVLRHQWRLCVSDVDGLRERILEEAHGSRYSIHPGATTMYRDLRMDNTRANARRNEEENVDHEFPLQALPQAPVYPLV
ncbi:hypothetical protein MTR67_043395 [Solanum verrucosum]|uniref:Uncharacterized protein n=1 Tax=Solanum verrucosum TaxID=315347 RepID=A0AAF0UQ69_SOLVR|nr:hypothetical protein MTR67_043395 [Solanum verrucosum]